MPQKTHGTVEEVLRIDSFKAKNQGFCCRLYAVSKDGDNLPFDCVPAELDHSYDPVAAKLTSVIFSKLWQNTVDISWIMNGFGGTRAYWVCPYCEKQSRFLYFDREEKRFRCRKCSNLNYRVQQETRKAYQQNELEDLPLVFRKAMLENGN